MDNGRTPEDYEEHLNGDSDGLGAARALIVSVMLGLVIVCVGLGVWVGWRMYSQ